jgi:hypothetical protein
MNLYFVVEGVTERKVYPAWLSYLLPELDRVNVSSKVEDNNYFLISGGGYPSIYNIIEDAIEEINDIKRYDYLVICLDAEENTVDYIEQEIQAKFNQLSSVKQFYLTNTNFKIIVHNRCLETWFLGNSKIYTRQPQSTELLNYTRYYNTFKDCPELMGNNNSSTHAQFHEDYLKTLFQEKNMKYSKTKPGDVQKEYYLNELKSRVQQQTTHLPSFQNFIAFCDLIRSQLSNP